MFKLLKVKLHALKIERTTSKKNMWKGERYFDSMFGHNFEGIEIPDAIYDKWLECYSLEEARLEMPQGSITNCAVREGDKSSDDVLKFTNKRTSAADLFIPKNLTRQVDFGKRDCRNKCEYVLYRIIRWFFVGVYFYFMPFLIIWFKLMQAKVIGGLIS